MGNPTLSWFLNLGDDDTPVWQEVTDNLYFFFTGPDTTTKQDQITPPTFNEFRWATELWLAESNFNNPSQCQLFVPPDNIKQSSNILRIDFDNDSASEIKLSAYDNDSADSTDNQMFNGIPWLRAIETSHKSQPKQNWINYTDMTSNGSTCNVLKGNNYYLECIENVSANDSKSFALACSLPSNGETIKHNWTYSVNYDYDSS